MKIQKIPCSSLADLNERIKYRLSRNKENTITRLQGNLDAKLVIISPIPNAECEQQNLPWTTEAATNFFQLLIAEAPPNYGHNSHFLVVPPVFYNVKKFKTGSEARALGILQLLASVKPRIFLCAGPGPFGMVFRGGATPDADCACGNLLYSPLVPKSVIYVFPDALPLGNSQDKNTYENFRAFAVAQAQIRQTLLHYAEVMPRFKKLIA